MAEPGGVGGGARSTVGIRHLPQAGETTDFGDHPAVYIEFLLAEESGDLVGSYHAQYQVPDKAISPEVALRIRSRAPLGKSTRAQWTPAVERKT
jgi:hypothetical protein